MHARATTAAALAALALALTACSSNSDDTSAPPAPSKSPAAATTNAPAAGNYETAQDIADALAGAGFTVTKLREETDPSYISKVGGTAYKFTVTDQSKPAGQAGINMFPNPQALDGWVVLSKQFGGVAVTRDAWAITLPTRDEAALADSKRMAPKIAEALDGTVQQ
ncbi:hypothetical protein OIE75_20320 [Streptomyces sp. NBC_01723]|uniref:hypothetical protein n=1 Tax=Streptomyces sp. NBC_01723 TaxID=2975921 RepID=UPI002E323D4D|nr:hypothetical protein [Streptomyces sp. NBC_01723]